MNDRRPGGEQGQLGGLEVIPFGLLILVVGALLLANLWGVVDGKLTVESAAREATRAYVEAPDEPTALARGQTAAEEAIRGHHRRVDAATIDAPSDGSFVRCARVTYTVSYAVPVLVLPWVRRVGSVFSVSARHSEVVDPYRSGLAVSNGEPCAR